MSKHYVWLFGKLSQAVGILVSNTGDARNRVWVAAPYLMQIPPGAVPPDCREDLKWIQHMLTRFPPGTYDDSALSATYRRTRNRTAGKIAQRVWHTYHVYDVAMSLRRGSQRGV
jgi:hypothetical protein